jgi:hypothetical protein
VNTDLQGVPGGHGLYNTSDVPPAQNLADTVSSFSSSLPPFLQGQAPMSLSSPSWPTEIPLLKEPTGLLHEIPTSQQPLTLDHG